MRGAFFLNSELQLLLAPYSDLLPGDQVDLEEPRRGLFVGSEVGVPAGMGASGWWSLDHLFLDQIRYRRSLSASCQQIPRYGGKLSDQILDYAANESAYWTQSSLRAFATETAARSDRAVRPNNGGWWWSPWRGGESSMLATF